MSRCPAAPLGHHRGSSTAGVAPLLRNLADSQLKARTGYSSGQLLRIFRVSALQMARDTRELTKLQGYVEKLQETVTLKNLKILSEDGCEVRGFLKVDLVFFFGACCCEDGEVVQIPSTYQSLDINQTLSP